METKKPATLKEFAEALAKEYGDFITRPVIVEGEGCSYRLFEDTYRNRGISLYSRNCSFDRPAAVAVRGIYPRRADSNASYVLSSDAEPAINVSAQRPAEAAWNDLFRRFIAPYQELWDKAQLRVEQEVDYERIFKRRHDQLCDILREHKFVVKKQHDERTVEFVSKHNVAGNIRIHVNSGGGLDQYEVAVRDLNAPQIGQFLKQLGKL